jgi:hypothetical protein
MYKADPARVETEAAGESPGALESRTLAGSLLVAMSPEGYEDPTVYVIIS